MSASPTFIGTPKFAPAQILPADTTTLKTVVTAGSSGSKLLGLTASSDDTSDRLVMVYVTRSGTDYLLGSATVTTLAGTNGVTTPAVNLLSYIPGLPADADGNRFLYLESGDVLKVKSSTTVTTAKTVHVAAVYGDI